MKKLNLAEWAAVAEIVGAIAVVASLIFLAQSVNRNTAQLQASNDNFLIQLSDENARDLIQSAELVSIILKFSRNEELTEVEDFRFRVQFFRDMNRWELAFVRHEQGFLDLVSWQVWDAALSDGFADRIPRSLWDESRNSFTPSFAEHVDEVYESATNR